MDACVPRLWRHGRMLPPSTGKKYYYCRHSHQNNHSFTPIPSEISASTWRNHDHSHDHRRSGQQKTNIHQPPQKPADMRSHHLGPTKQLMLLPVLEKSSLPQPARVIIVPLTPEEFFSVSHHQNNHGHCHTPQQKILLTPAGKIIRELNLDHRFSRLLLPAEEIIIIAIAVQRNRQTSFTRPARRIIISTRHWNHIIATAVRRNHLFFPRNCCHRTFLYAESQI